MAHALTAPRPAALLVLVGAAATVGGALIFQHVLGYVPCKLCLTERQPYYLAVPLLAAALLLPRRPASWLLALVAVIFLVGAGLGAYHAGAEWGFWPGPSDCGGGAGPAPAGVNDFLKALESTRPVDCTAAAWRFLGISLAGYNALIAVVLAAFAGIAALRGLRRG
ncbi:disulfide bond formation protein B [Methylobacterium currus]|uniref:Disulfide bond formation protein B n=2 Tax=Methylobacterium currus TaxID=2051553 RepID=A0A2R4WWM8_9HYPH|nr:disulfide bond formation protein B [Methylobacterium currus]AWB25959.1 disulfide bond formation protein B [Methylobacterium currus]UHC19825.1 disulfide bond formation protein B [Methylobacterium currus]